MKFRTHLNLITYPEIVSFMRHIARRLRFAFWIYGVLLCTTYTVYLNFRAYDSVMRIVSLRN